MRNDHKFTTLHEKNLMSSSSLDPISAGRLVALFSSQNRLNQETFSDREDFPEDNNRFLGAKNLSLHSLIQ